MSKKGANQYGSYKWIPHESLRAEAKYSARVMIKGCSVKVNADNKDELVNDLTELLDRITPLTQGKAVSNENED